MCKRKETRENSNKQRERNPSTLITRMFFGFEEDYSLWLSLDHIYRSGQLNWSQHDERCHLKQSRSSLFQWSVDGVSIEPPSCLRFSTSASNLLLRKSKFRSSVWPTRFNQRSYFLEILKFLSSFSQLDLSSSAVVQGDSALSESLVVAVSLIDPKISHSMLPNRVSRPRKSAVAFARTLLTQHPYRCEIHSENERHKRHHTQNISTNHSQIGCTHTRFDAELRRNDPFKDSVQLDEVYLHGDEHRHCSEDR